MMGEKVTCLGTSPWNGGEGGGTAEDRKERNHHRESFIPTLGGKRQPGDRRM